MSIRELALHRFCYAPFGVFGRFTLDDGVWIFTVERPWLDNAPFVSSIPDGGYLCAPRRFYKGGYDAIEIRDVPGRSHILFHKANWPDELAGCIAPNARLVAGNDRCPLRGAGSAQAFERLMNWSQYRPDGNFTLRVLNATGAPTP